MKAAKNKKIGHMQKTKIIAEPEDKSFQIWQVRYQVKERRARFAL